MSKKQMVRKVYGVGINDADYAVYQTIEGKRVVCPYYAKWRGMLLRQTPKNWKRHPSYKGCKVCDRWLKFSNFKRWMVKQNHTGKQLDKDLLGDGKLYSPETCVFVSHAINNFMEGCRASRGEWPIGVSWHKRDQKFRSSLSINGKLKTLGLFDTPEEAHETWRKAKKALCLELINNQTCPRTKRGLRKYMGSI